ncbi:MAG: RimK-like ATPgrasp N-terminal domain-containing protein [Gemmatimonadetes bacterium]|nr:RimK-like ATPgrasp N-terminal domain-containing protein [Gemmatimonadota bacterium]
MVRLRLEQLIAYHEPSGCYLNLAGDYDYLTTGYYFSQQAEADGMRVHPTCKEILDAYVTPLFLEKARLAGLAVPEYYVTNDYFEPPVVIDPINPFMSRHAVVRKPSQQQRMARSLTRNFTYAMCCQELPDGARVGWFRCVLGRSASPRYRELAAALWNLFRIPIARVRVIVPPAGIPLPSAVYPLSHQRLHRRELALIHREVQWPT